MTSSLTRVFGLAIEPLGDGGNSPGPIFERLMAVADGRPHERGSLVPIGHQPLSLRERKRLLREVDRLHRDGEPWPRWAAGRGGSVVPFAVRVNPNEFVRQTPRPDHLPYCVRWTGAYWAPCSTPGQRKDAGYCALMMCWPGYLPKAGTYLVSGERARFAYRIAEVEPFAEPRGAKGYTCRLWCDRLAPADVPKNAAIDLFYWHPRGRKRARA